ncbi:MAG: alpha/beta fold hydrolase [Magnetococcales bacterium]|nr:alpha/beta fold hydrolase [Magnetococcales bacterium]
MNESFWLGSVILSGVIVYGFACLRLFVTQHRKVFLPGRKGEESPRDWGLDYEPLVIDDGEKRLHAWWIPGAHERFVVLFCHGNGVSMHHLAQHVLFLRPLGGSIVLFDYRGYGDSEGTPDEERMLADGDTVWRYLVSQRGIAGKNILLYGHSLGGGVATWLAGRYRPVGVVLEGTFTSIPDLGVDHYPWLPVRLLARIQIDNLARIGAIVDPLFIVHSTEDTLIPFHHAQRLYDRATCRKHLLAIGGRHNDAFVQTRDRGVAALKTFFRLEIQPGL